MQEDRVRKPAAHDLQRGDLVVLCRRPKAPASLCTITVAEELDEKLLPTGFRISAQPGMIAIVLETGLTADWSLYARDAVRVHVPELGVTGYVFEGEAKTVE